MGLTPKHLQVLGELAEQGKISRTQLTVGPLRHVERDQRRQVMDDLEKAHLVEVTEIKPQRGPSKQYYRITDEGRRLTSTSQG